MEAVDFDTDLGVVVYSGNGQKHELRWASRAGQCVGHSARDHPVSRETPDEWDKRDAKQNGGKVL